MAATLSSNWGAMATSTRAAAGCSSNACNSANALAARRSFVPKALSLALPRSAIRRGGVRSMKAVRSDGSQQEDSPDLNIVKRTTEDDADIGSLWKDNPMDYSMDEETSPIQSFLFPAKEELPDDVEMSIWEHFEELRERVFLAAIVAGFSILACFCFSKDLVVLLEEPVVAQGVRFLQLSPGEYFFTTLKVAGYTGLLLSAPTVLYEVASFVIPGLTKNERQFLGPIVFGSSGLFYGGLFFSYSVLTPAALKFFVEYADGAVESLWSIDQYFEFVLVLMLSTGLSFQVPVVQLLLGSTGVVSSTQMLSVWRYVVVGAVVAAAVLTPSTDPFTQTLLAVPLILLYIGGALGVKAIESSRKPEAEFQE